MDSGTGNEFIEKISKYVIKHAPKYDIKIHSPIIAQAVLESACGTSELAQKACNYFGLKYKNELSDEYYIKVGSEQKKDGTYISSVMKWCKFSNMEECVIGYFKFLQAARYANLKGEKNPREYLVKIKNDGYATSLKYVDNVMAVIKKYDLEKFDNKEEENGRMRIGLNAGHTLSGAGSGTSGVIVESIETRRVCSRLTEMLKSSGVEVVPCTVDKAASQSAYLQQAVNMANRTDLDYFISIHFNNDKARKGHGVEVYTYKGRQYPDAVEVCEHIAALGFTNRGVKEGSGLYVIKKTKAKSMLIEVCFVNDPDAATYKLKFEQICAAIAYALADYVQAAPKPVAPVQLPEKKKYVKVLVDNLAVRKSLSWDSSAVAGRVQKNEVFTVARGPVKVGGGSMYELKSGLHITASEKYVTVYEK